MTWDIVGSEFREKLLDASCGLEILFPSERDNQNVMFAVN